MVADLILEEVPEFSKRYSDYSVFGSNNTLMVFGTDRPSGKLSGYREKGAGTVHIVTGRKGKDPNFSTDSSFVYVSSKTDADKNLGLDSAEVASNGFSSVIAKSDTVRIVHRRDMKISSEKGNEYIFIGDKKMRFRVGNNFVLVTDKEVVIDVGEKSFATLDGSKIELKIGNSTFTMNAGASVLSTPKFSTVGGADAPRDAWASALLEAMLTHTHMTVVGPTLPVAAGLPPPNTKIVAELPSKYSALKLETLT